jgi:hypothetical protein
MQGCQIGAGRTRTTAAEIALLRNKNIDPLHSVWFIISRAVLMEEYVHMLRGPP